MIVLLRDAEALSAVDAAAIIALTEAATNATFYREGLGLDQIGHNRHIVAISGETARAAIANAHQLFVAAQVDGRFAGFVIATKHDADSHELDWLMVHPDFHGTDVSRSLMDAGMDWLGRDRPMWLNVIQYNARAIAFYRRFGFDVTGPGSPDRPIAQFVMQRAGTP